MLPTWAETPPRTVGSTRASSTTLRWVSDLRVPARLWTVPLEGARGEGDGARHLAAHATGGGIGHVPVEAGDVRQVGEPAAVHQQAQGVGEDGLHRAQGLEEPLHHAGALLAGEGRVEEDVRQLAVLRERTGEGGELLGHRVGATGFGRDVEERASVTAGD
jgi:hypothetical protein